MNQQDYADACETVLAVAKELVSMGTRTSLESAVIDLVSTHEFVTRLANADHVLRLSIYAIPALIQVNELSYQEPLLRRTMQASIAMVRDVMDLNK